MIWKSIFQNDCGNELMNRMKESSLSGSKKTFGETCFVCLGLAWLDLYWDLVLDQEKVLV